MGVKIDPVVLDTVATRATTLRDDVHDILAEARRLDAGWAVSTLSGIPTWADDTAADLRARIDIVTTLEQQTVTGFGVGTVGWREIAGGRTPVALTISRISALELQPDVNAAWARRPGETLDEWMTRLGGQAIDELTGLDGLGRPVAEFYHWWSESFDAFKAGGMTALAAATIGKVSLTRGLLVPAMQRLGLSDLAIEKAILRYGTYRAPGTTMQTIIMRMLPFDRIQSVPPMVQRWAASSGLRSLLPAIETRLPRIPQNLYQGIFGAQEYTYNNAIDPKTGKPLTMSRGASNLISVARDAPAGARWSTVAGTAGVIRGLGVVGQGAAAVVSTAQVVSHGNPVDAFQREGAGYVADVAKAGLDISLTAALIAPNPVTWGAVAVTGAVYVGAEVVDNWDEISAATEQAAEWTADQAVKAAAWVGDQLDDIDDVGDVIDKVADSTINPMNWF